MKIKFPKNQEIIQQCFDGHKVLRYVITKDNTGLFLLYEVNEKGDCIKIKTNKTPVKLDEYAYEIILKE